MGSLTEPVILDAVERSLIETVEAFVRFRPGFHGDTGMRDFLYHRLMSNLPDGGTYCRADGSGTLLAQAEWYTALKYRKTGETPSRGRFDIGIPRPGEIESPDPPPFVAIECGRNKKAGNLLGDFDAGAEHEGPEPADLTKLIREINHANLPYGYALEFYDEDVWQADLLVAQLQASVPESASGRLRVIVLVCVGNGTPVLRLLPKLWDEQVHFAYHQELGIIEHLTCTLNGAPRRAPGEGALNRVPEQDFLSSCSAAARDLIDEVQRRLGAEIKLVFGGNTMTVNRRPKGLLLRIEKARNCLSELDPIMRQNVSARLGHPASDLSYGIEEGSEFRDAIVASITQVLRS